MNVLQFMQAANSGKYLNSMSGLNIAPTALLRGFWKRRENMQRNVVGNAWKSEHQLNQLGSGRSSSIYEKVSKKWAHGYESSFHNRADIRRTTERW